MHIKIGTRGSKLALWQAEHIKYLLQQNGMTSEIVIIHTKGDKILDVTISKIGSKGVFTEELENQLESGEIDIAVHSAKDLQSHLPQHLELIAFTKRELPNDVIVSFNPDFDLNDLTKTIVVGSSSTRRVALLRHYYPHIFIVDMRGNLQSRFEKLKNNVCDAMILAYAGVHRMNLDQYIVKILPTDQFFPPVGQGCIAIECATNLIETKKKAIRLAVNDENTEMCLIAERAFLHTMNGGCSIPTYALATLPMSNKLQIMGGIARLDGSQIIVENVIDDLDNPANTGSKLASTVLDSGGAEILTYNTNQLSN